MLLSNAPVYSEGLMQLSKLTKEEYYSQFYDLLLEDMSSKPLSRMVRLTHKSLERNNSKEKEYKTVLELGAGTGKHFKYVKHKYNKYIESDIRPRKTIKSEKFRDNRLRFKIIDAQKLNQFQEGTIDRIISTCVLIHLENPSKALNEWRRVINKKNGQISLYIPCEPGFVLRILRYVTTVQKARKFGVNHLFFHYKEHKFNYLYLKTIVDEVFIDCDVKWRKYPFIFGSWNFNLWSICTINFTKTLRK
jgi:SAM-dependent methyltransferase